MIGREKRQKEIMARQGRIPKGEPHELTDTESQQLNALQKDPEKRLNDDELDLISSLKMEGMHYETIIQKIFEERKKNKE